MTTLESSIIMPIFLIVLFCSILIFTALYSTVCADITFLTASELCLQEKVAEVSCPKSDVVRHNPLTAMRMTELTLRIIQIPTSK